MKIIKIGEAIGGKGGLELMALLDTVLFYAALAKNTFFNLCGYRPGEERIYDFAMVVLAITTPILIIKVLLKVIIKVVALSAVFILMLGRICPLPTSQLLAVSILLSFGILTFIRMVKH
ncbi:MAG: hypothetical protein CO189_06010 [candidate division Zixibacteria bacterium CG_4_9_14_3_um_filter_46_8]|nr:MAG: hypothetical protein CO189_06010 [candidate division Zixibacteria bacterium CG_4_9_14_3_um_filter_46_8]